jgi:hypothetical protein
VIEPSGVVAALGPVLGEGAQGRAQLGRAGAARWIDRWPFHGHILADRSAVQAQRLRDLSQGLSDPATRLDGLPDDALPQGRLWVLPGLSIPLVGGADGAISDPAGGVAAIG